MAYNLSEEEEIRKKRIDFNGRANGVLAHYNDASPEVQMVLLSSYCCHLYGSQAWNYTDKHVFRIVSGWNKVVRRIWHLPFDSHTVVLAGLNKGKHVWDMIFRRFCKMYMSMSKSDNITLSFLIKMSECDKRSIIARNI